MKGRLLAIFALVLAVSLLSARPAAAGTVTFTSTADFDAGTKSQPTPADGNYQVETNTDNLGIATGAFELTSLKGDSFTLADTDADTFKWTRFSRPASRCASGAIASGVLTVSITSDSASECGVSSDATVSGSFDVRMQFVNTISGSNSQKDLCLYDTASECSNTAGALSANADGVFLRHLVNSGLAVLNVTGGAVTQIGTTTTVASSTIWHRIARSGNTWTTYYSTDGSAWTQDEQIIRAAPTSVYVTGVLVINGVNDGTMNMDSYSLPSGTVDSGGYRTSGTWTSLTQTYAGEVVSQIDLTFSGATSANYIDSVAVLDSGGGVLFSDGTDITSGTTASVTVPYDVALQADWAVRIGLASGGAGTPTIENVDVVTVLPPSTGDTGGGSRRISVTCALDWLTQAISCDDRSNYEGARVAGVNWYVDGQIVLSTGENARVALPTRDSILSAHAGVRHEVIMELVLVNGGRQPHTIEVLGDYTPRLVIFASMGAAIVTAFAIGTRRATTRSIAFPRVTNPSYRRTAISVDEYPRGWVSYRQREPERYTTFRTKVLRREGRKATVVAVFGIRPATPAERARTGRPRIAELQTVRERLPRARR